jgi:hypothetical protein
MSTTSIGIGTNTPAGTLQIKGIGNTASTTSFSVINSSGIQGLAVSDDGTAYAGWDTTGGTNSYFSANGDVSLGRYGLGLTYIKSTGAVKLQSNNFQFAYGSLYMSNSSLLSTGSAGFGVSPSLARLQVRGSGSTSATTALLVQNSNTDAALRVLDDGSVSMGITGQTTWAATFSANSGIQGRIGNSIFESPSQIYRYNGGTLTFFGKEYSNSAFFYSYDGTIQSTSTTQALISLGSTYANQQSFQFASIRINPTYDFASNTTSNAIARGIYYNPTITNLRVAQHRAIETVTGDVLFGTTSGKATFGSGVAGTSYIEIKPGTFAGNNRITFNDFDGGSRGGWLEMSTYSSELIFGNYNSLNIGPSTKKYRLYFEPANQNVIISQGFVAPTDSDALFQVKGSGSTSATTSLLVQNSSGLTALSITDDRTVSIGTLSVSGLTTTGVSSLTGQTNITGLSSIWQCQYAATGTVKPLSFSMQSGSFSANNSAIQFGFNYRASGGLFSQDIFQNILYDNTAGSVVTGFEWFTHQTQVGDASSQLALSLRGKTLSVGTNTPSASAILQADSTTQGVLFPRMTTAQKLAIASPVGGLQVYDTTLNQMSYYNGTAWINF